MARLVNNVWFRSDEKYPTGSRPISYIGQENRLPSRGTLLLHVRAFQQFANVLLFRRFGAPHMTLRQKIILQIYH